MNAMSASIGIAVSVGGRGSAEMLLNEADTAMYHAKSLGGGRAVVFDAALGRQVQQRSAAQQILQSALDDHRVVVHYQPVIDLVPGNIVGFEALARIAEDDGSMLPPRRSSLPPRTAGWSCRSAPRCSSMACHEASHGAARTAAVVPLTSPSTCRRASSSPATCPLWSRHAREPRV